MTDESFKRAWKKLIKIARQGFFRKTERCFSEEKWLQYHRGELSRDELEDMELHMAFCGYCVKSFRKTGLVVRKE